MKLSLEILQPAEIDDDDETVHRLDSTISV